jgi:hypothetical protein
MTNDTILLFFKPSMHNKVKIPFHFNILSPFTIAEIKIARFLKPFIGNIVTLRVLPFGIKPDILQL